MKSMTTLPILAGLFFIVSAIGLHLFFRKMGETRISKKEWLLSGHYYIQWILIISGLLTLGFVGVWKWI